MRLIAILPALLCAVALAPSGLLPVEAPVPIEPAEAVMTYRIMEERTMPKHEKTMSLLTCNELEIIGNVHDDPNLLTGGKE